MKQMIKGEEIIIRKSKKRKIFQDLRKISRLDYIASANITATNIY